MANLMPCDEFARLTTFTVAEHHGRWWLDRQNPDGFTAGAVGPFGTRAQAAKLCKRLNKINQEAGHGR